MKIKGLAAALVLCMAAVTRLHSFGLGVQANFRAGDIFAPGAALVLSPSNRTHLAVNWHIAEEVNTFGFTGDYCPMVLQIINFRQARLNFTLGVGLFTNIKYAKRTDGELGVERREHGIDGGIRAPVGFNLMLFDGFFEIYTHVAPSFVVQFAPKLDLTNLFFPVALGGRFWFR